METSNKINVLLHSNDNLLTTEQAAKILGLKNPHTLCVWRTTKRYPLPYIKIGRLVRYRLEDLQAFLQKQTEGFEKSTSI